MIRKEVLTLILAGVTSSMHASEILDIVVDYHQTFIVKVDGEILKAGRDGKLSKPNDYEFRKFTQKPNLKKVVKAGSGTFLLLGDGKILKENDQGKFEALAIPKMKSLSGNYNDLHAITETGELWVWYKNGFYKVETPFKIRKFIIGFGFSAYAEDDQGQIWLALKNYKKKGFQFKKAGFVKNQSLVNGNRNILMTKDTSKLYFYLFKSGIVERVEHVSLLDSRSVELPKGSGKFITLLDTVYYLVDNSLYEINCHYEYHKKLPPTLAWKKVEVPMLKRFWTDKDGTHKFIETEAGKLMAMGKNSGGALGFPFMTVAPTKIRGLESIESISSNYTSNVALNDQGEVYVWGDSKLSANLENRHNPKKIEMPKMKLAVEKHSKGLAISHDNHLYLWGRSNEYIQKSYRGFFGKLKAMMTSSIKDYKKPVLISEIANATKILGMYHDIYGTSAAILDSSGRAWKWTKADLSNPFYLLYSSFSPPKVFHKLAKDELEVYLADESKVILKKDGSLEIVGKYRARPNVSAVEKVFPVSETEFYLLHTDRSLSSLSLGREIKVTTIDKNVFKIFKGKTEPLLLKERGELYNVKGEVIYKFDSKIVAEIKDITEGSYHYLMLKKDGSVWAWGEKNNQGQMGLDIGPINKFTEVKI